MSEALKLGGREGGLSISCIVFHCVAAALHCNLSVALLYDVGLSRYLYVRAGGLAAPCRENFAAQSRVVEEEEEEEEGEPRVQISFQVVRLPPCLAMQHTLINSD